MFLNAKTLKNYNFKLNDKNLIERPNTSLPGLSSKYVMNKIITLTKKYCNKKNLYVEIGTFKGYTSICNAFYNKNKTDFYTIDNFKFGTKNLNIFNKNKKKFKTSNLNLINADFEKAFEILKKKRIKIGLLFVDGPHDYRSQYIILERFKKLLSNKACIIIDDANYKHVRLATHDFLSNNQNYKLSQQYYSTKHPSLLSFKLKNKLQNWNGLHVIEKNSLKRSQKLKINLKNAKKFHLESHDIQNTVS